MPDNKNLISTLDNRRDEIQQAISQALRQGEDNYAAGETKVAEDLFRAIIDMQPEHPEANHNLGVLLTNSGNTLEGIPFLRTAVAHSPKEILYWVSLIEALVLSHELEAAEATIELSSKTGITAPELEIIAQKIRAHRLMSGPESSNKQSLAIEQSATSEKAVTDVSSGATPSSAEVKKQPAVSKQDSNKIPEQPTKAPSGQDFKKLASLIKRGKNTALENFSRNLITRFPEHGIGWKTLAGVLMKQGRSDEALPAMENAVKYLPDDPNLLNDYGLLLQRKGRIGEALALYNKALEIDANHYPGLINSGDILRQLNRFKESETRLHLAVQINANEASLNQLGNTLIELNRFVDAEVYYRKALRLNPRSAGSHTNLGVSLRKQGRLDEAIKHQKRAAQLNPENYELLSHLLFTLNYTTNAPDLSHLEEAKRYGRLLTNEAKEPYTEWLCTHNPKRLRVGFVSGDLINHPVGYFLESILQKFDKNQVEIIIYSTNVFEDDLTKRIKRHVCSWQKLSSVGPKECAEIIHKDKIHILFDLAGHTSRNRMPSFAWKPAPLQIAWLGYFATTGLKEMDFIMVDEVGVPQSQSENFTEALWFLPKTRLCFSTPNASISPSPLPAVLNGYITFGCFQQITKITDHVLYVWSTVLKDIPNSRLRWQCRQFSDPAVVELTLQKMQEFGIGRDRIITHGSMPRELYLAAHSEVDVILDTFPYPGGTTTCEALWMGVPTLTLSGNSLLSRQGASLLTAAGLTEWVVNSEAEYLQKAKLLTANLNELAEIRAKLRGQVLRSPLFDADLFARNFQNALWEMWQLKQPPKEVMGPSEQEVLGKFSWDYRPEPRVFLHVDCGYKRKEHTSRGFNTDDWIELRVDLKAEVKPDIFGSVSDMSKITNESANSIYSSNQIQRFYFHEVLRFFQESFRILKEDGFLVITCPDLKAACSQILNDTSSVPFYDSDMGKLSALDVLFGAQGLIKEENKDLSHRSGFTEKLLTQFLRQTGFPAVASTSRLSSGIWALASKTFRSEMEMRELAAQYFIKS